MESKLTTVTIPSSVYAIGESAFYSCKDLTKVVIQNSSSSSQSSSACSCISTSSSSSSAPTSSSSSSAQNRKLTNIPALCFFSCNKLQEIVLPESIVVVEEEAFHGCSALRSTIAFMNIEKICYRAFQGCSSLKKVYISSSFFEKDSNDNPIGVIEDKAFDSCNSGLVFYLIGDVDDIETWTGMTRNRNWNQKSALVDPGDPIDPEVTSTKRYKYYTPGENSGAVFTSDWIYTIDQNNDVDINSYIGPTEIDSVPIKFISIPNDFDGKYVRSISKTALDSVKGTLQRIYLPKQLRRIEAEMFDSSYTNLIVVDDNTQCSGDETYLGQEGHTTLSSRIVLNGLTNLEVIGKSAFVDMPHLGDVTKLYLPYSLKGVGSNAFGTSATAGKHMMSCTDFKWDYDDTNSALQVIGKEAFYELGRSDNSASITDGNAHQGHIASVGTNNYELTTLIIPRTFKHFGIKSTDVTNIPGLTAETDDANFGISAFAGCPLLSKVVFKGSKQSVVQNNPNSSYVENDTFDLVLASKTFAMNESLRTVVFEERVNKSIVFNTYGGLNQPVIGWSSGKSQNDFGGDPALQTLVLPNKYTTLRIQDNAFIGNSRGVIYLSNSTGSNLKGCTTASMVSLINSPATDGDLALPTDWRKIGKDLSGYNFINENAFGLDQKMPVYGSVLYKDTIVTTDDVVVGYGNTNLYIVKEKCAFVTNGSTDATMTNYLYDRYSAFAGTAVVPYQVGTNNLSVVKIGDSAFSACYCDSNSYSNITGHSDLTAIKVPDTVTSIGEYALMRAYGIVSFSSYHVNTGNGDEVQTGYTYQDEMPSGVTSIGKHAFAFCNVKKFLKINTNCVFYENSNLETIENTNITSVFSNNYSLRQITFGTTGAASGNNYTTTTYTHSGTEDNGATYTSAIYSTASVPKNQKSLLLVLNRDSGDDRLSASSDFTVATGATYGTFNGRYGYSGNTPTVTNHLYGAFKMCYWVKSLVLGTPNNIQLNQPLISGIYDKTTNEGQIVYLESIYDFESFDATSLENVAFGDSSSTSLTISAPPYAFAGCDNLASITLPRVEQSGVTIPAGLFASVSNPDVVFRVPQWNEDEEEYYYDNCDKGVLDLTHTNYSGIDRDAFKGTNLKQVIAPITENFTIGEDAFANCTQLTNVDLRNVTGAVYLNASFRGATISSTLFKFGSAKIYFNDETFKGCTFSNESFEFPVKTAKIGDSCFESCDTLKTVTTAGGANLVDLEKVTVPNGTPQDNNIIVDEYVDAPGVPPTNFASLTVIQDRGGYFQIGNYAFYLCKNLTSFPFSKFTTIERIGHFAFSMNNNGLPNDIVANNATNLSSITACICPDGDVNLPASLTNIGVGAFNSSKIKNVKINSSEMRFERGKTYTSILRAKYDLGGHQFQQCGELLTVMFTNGNCKWKTPYIPKGSNTGQDNYFSNCSKLTAVYLPVDYDIQHWEDLNSPSGIQRPDSMVWNSKKAVVYLYHTLDNWNGNAICRYWHNTSQTTDNLVFYVAVITDVATSDGNGNYSLRTLPMPTQKFWTKINNVPVLLGTIKDNQPELSDGIIEFSSGYKVSSTGVFYPS